MFGNLGLQLGTRIASEAGESRRTALSAYALLILFGALGAHRFYFGRWATGSVLAFVTLSGVFWMLPRGAFPLVPLVLWLLMDAVLIRRWLQHDRRARLASIYG